MRTTTLIRNSQGVSFECPVPTHRKLEVRAIAMNTSHTDSGRNENEGSESIMIDINANRRKTEQNEVFLT